MSGQRRQEEGLWRAGGPAPVTSPGALTGWTLAQRGCQADGRLLQQGELEEGGRTGLC